MLGISCGFRGRGDCLFLFPCCSPLGAWSLCLISLQYSCTCVICVGIWRTLAENDESRSCLASAQLLQSRFSSSNLALSLLMRIVHIIPPARPGKAVYYTRGYYNCAQIIATSSRSLALAASAAKTFYLIRSAYPTSAAGNNVTVMIRDCSGTGKNFIR
jgi:hypothetical protein